MKSALARREPLPRCVLCNISYQHADGINGYCSRECFSAANPVRCGECRESVIFHDDGSEPYLINGRSSFWRHVRTGNVRCSPLCACGQPGVHALGGTSFDGAGTRFLAREFVCEACLAERRKSQLMVERQS